MGEGAAAEFGGARHQKVFGAEPMPTMNTRERPRIAADGFEQLLLVADRAVGEEHDLADVVGVAAALSVSAARIAGTISVPPRACSAPTNALACADMLARRPARRRETARPWCRRSGSR